MNEFNPKLHFLENINVQNGKADAITTAVNLLMEKRNLHKDKMKGFGSSGVSVMTGKNNEVSKRMKDDSPFLVSIHCMAHRLALCTSQVANGIPYLAKFKEILAALQGLSQAAPLHQSCTAIEIVWLCFSLPSIILMDLLGKQKFTLMGSKGYGLWFVICDWWFQSILCLSVSQGLLLAIVIMIDSGEKSNCEGGFWILEFACLWKVE